MGRFLRSLYVGRITEYLFWLVFAAMMNDSFEREKKKRLEKVSKLEKRAVVIRSAEKERMESV